MRAVQVRRVLGVSGWAIAMLGAAAWGAAGSAFTFQATIQRDNVLVNNELCDCKFRLYDASGGTNQIGGEQLADDVLVNGGALSALLDFGADAFNGADRWLEWDVQCGSDTGFSTMSPRIQLTPTPAAIAAGKLTATDLSGNSTKVALDELSGQVVVTRQTATENKRIEINAQTGSLAAFDDSTVANTPSSLDLKHGGQVAARVTENPDDPGQAIMMLGSAGLLLPEEGSQPLGSQANTAAGPTPPTVFGNIRTISDWITIPGRPPRQAISIEGLSIEEVGGLRAVKRDRRELLNKRNILASINNPAGRSNFSRLPRASVGITRRPRVTITAGELEDDQFDIILDDGIYNTLIVRPEVIDEPRNTRIRIDMLSAPDESFQDDDSPNSLVLGAEGPMHAGTAYIDTAAAGVAAPTPLSLRTSGVERMRLDTAGNVGIGTSNPQYKLDVSSTDAVRFNFGADGGGQLAISHVFSDNDSLFLVAGNRNFDGNAEGLFFTGYGLAPLPMIQLTADETFVTGNLGVGGSSPTTKFYVNTAANNDYTAVIENAGGDGQGLLIRASDGAGTNPILNVESPYGTTRLAVLESGNVGIGTTNPGVKLTVNDAGGVVGVRSGLGALVTGGGNGGGIYLGVDPGTSSTAPTGAVETSWGDAGNPQIAIGVTRDGARANVLMDYGGNTRIRNGTTSLLFVDGSTGFVGINTESPTARLHVAGNIYSGGTISANVSCCSDRRLKTNFERLGGSLKTLGKLNGVHFDWRKDEFPQRGFTSGRQIGFVAQDVAEVVPELVTQDGEGFLAIDYGRFTPILVEAIKEQQTQIDEKDRRISELEAKAQSVEELEKKVATLEALVNRLAASKNGGGQ